MPPSSRGLGHLPFTEVTGIRIPLGVIVNQKAITFFLFLMAFYIQDVAKKNAPKAFLVHSFL